MEDDRCGVLAIVTTNVPTSTSASTAKSASASGASAASRTPAALTGVLYEPERQPIERGDERLVVAANRPATIPQPPERLDEIGEASAVDDEWRDRQDDRRDDRGHRRGPVAPGDKIQNQERGEDLQGRGNADKDPCGRRKPERHLPRRRGNQRQQQRIHVLMLEVGQCREQDRGKRRKEHRQPWSLWLAGAVTNGVQGFQAEPDTKAEARKIQRVPKDLRREWTPSGDRRKRRKEHRLERWADEAVGGAAPLVERLGVQEPPASLEKDRRIPAFIDGVDCRKNREEQREEEQDETGHERRSVRSLTAHLRQGYGGHPSRES